MDEAAKTSASAGATSSKKAAADTTASKSKDKAPPAKPAGAIKTLAKACEAAVAGNVDAAIPALEGFAAKGSATARAALAQIRAYRGDWNGVIDAVSQLLADPNDIYAGNVIDDAKSLLLRAGHETKRWSDVAAAVKKQKPFGHGKNPIVAHLLAQAKAGGALPAPRPPADSLDTLPDAARRSRYESAMKEQDELRKKGKEKPGERAQTQFRSGWAYGQIDRAIEAWPGAEPFVLWDTAVQAAAMFAQASRPDEAWAILERKIHQFWPVDGAQVAPWSRWSTRRCDR